MHRTSIAASRFLLTLTVALAGCATDATLDGQAGDPGVGSSTSEALTVATCSEAAIRGAAPANATAVLDRAFDWIHRAVPYCECVTGAGGAYRTDCSGFVSNAWGLPAPGHTTYSFAGGPWDDHASVRIGMGDLQVGDALNYPGNPSAGTGHVVLFGGWLDDAHTRFCSLEESHRGLPAHVIVRAVDPAFLPMRLAGYAPGATTVTAPSAPAAPDPRNTVGIAPSHDGGGYLLVAGDGGVYALGDAGFRGSLGGMPLNAAVVGIAATPSGAGYWLVASDGGVFAFGDAPFRGSMGGQPLNAPVVGIAAAPSGNGYWLVASDGGVFTFGDAGFFGSMGGQHLNAAVVGIAPTRSGAGYWLVASDGGVFAFGDAGFFGSMGGQRLNAPVVGLAASPSAGGYWLVASDGGVFAFGDAGFFGSMGGHPLNAPVTSIAPSASGRGYWMVAHDGGVFTFGDAGFFGATPHG